MFPSLKYINVLFSKKLYHKKILFQKKKSFLTGVLFFELFCIIFFYHFKISYCLKIKKVLLFIISIFLHFKMKGRKKRYVLFLFL
jgi:hypothetical protein